MKHTVLYINPGPSYYPHTELYQKEYKKLSKYFKGYILTSAPRQEYFDIGAFTYISMKSDGSKIDKLKFFFFCLWHSINFLMQGQKIDLVKTYDPLATGLIGLVIARVLRAKFAVEVNGVYTSAAEWLDNPDSLENKIKKKIYPLIMKFVLKRADGIRLLFKQQIDRFKDLLHDKVIYDFRRWVSTSDFRNIREDKDVLFVGFPFKRKGVDVLIKAFKKISPRYPEWKLKILGWYPNPEELYKAIDGHPQIYHHKPVPTKEMPKHIASCAIFVLPSRSEAMGRVLLEAMAAGKPRIGSNVDGIPMVINDGADGLLVKPGDVDDLAKKLDLLMGNPDLRHRLGRAGYIRARKEFTLDVYIKNLTNFYNDVLRKK